jgi:hypothetical protein
MSGRAVAVEANKSSALGIINVVYASSAWWLIKSLHVLSTTLGTARRISSQHKVKAHFT